MTAISAALERRAETKKHAGGPRLLGGRTLGGWLQPPLAPCVVAACVAAYAVAFVVLYPRMYSSIDEAEYLQTAVVLSRGSPDYLTAGVVPAPMTFQTNGMLVSKHMPGNSLTLVPFLLLNPTLVFLRGPLLLVGSWVLFNRTLVRLGLRYAPLLSLLYLLYPPFVLQARTLLSELPAVAVATAGWYLLCARSSWLLAGVAFGLLTAFRETNLAIPIAIVGVQIIRLLRSQRREVVPSQPSGAEVARFSVGVALGCLAIGAWFAYFRIDPLALWQHSGGTLFAVHFLPRNVAFYAAALGLMHPLLGVAWLSPAARRVPWLAEILATSGIMVIPALFYYYLPEWDNAAERLVLGMRLILVVIPGLLIIYSAALDHLVGRLAGALSHVRPRTDWGTLTLSAGICGLFAVALYGSLRHQAYLSSLVAQRDALYAESSADTIIVGNGDAEKLINVAYGRRDFRSLAFEDRCLDVSDVMNGGGSVLLAIVERPYKEYYASERACADAILAMGRWQEVPSAPGLRLYARAGVA